MQRKSQKTLIITGAGKGLGRGFALAAASAGYQLAVVSRTESELLSLKSEISTKYGSFVSIHAVDLTDESATRIAFDCVAENHPNGIGGIVCFAGTWTPGKDVYEFTLNDMQLSMKSNFNVTFSAIHETLRISKANSNGLVILTIGGTSASWMNPSAAGMSIAKAAIRNYSRVLAKQLSKYKIHVAHIMIDGPVLNERGKFLNPTLKEEEFISMDSLSRELLHVIAQEEDCWTFEWDVRTYNRDSKII